MMTPYDDGDPHLVFLNRTREEGRNMRQALQEAFEHLIVNASERDFTRLFDAIAELKRKDHRLYQSLMGQNLVRALLDAVNTEDQFRCHRGIDQRNGAA